MRCQRLWILREYSEYKAYTQTTSESEIENNARSVHVCIPLQGTIHKMIHKLNRYQVTKLHQGAWTTRCPYKMALPDRFGTLLDSNHAPDVAVVKPRQASVLKAPLASQLDKQNDLQVWLSFTCHRHTNFCITHCFFFFTSGFHPFTGKQPIGNLLITRLANQSTV